MEGGWTKKILFECFKEVYSMLEEEKEREKKTGSERRNERGMNR